MQARLELRRQSGNALVTVEGCIVSGRDFIVTRRHLDPREENLAALFPPLIWAPLTLENWEQNQLVAAM